MPDEQPEQQQDQVDDAGEGAFWDRLGREIDTRSDAAFERALARLSDQVDAEQGQQQDDKGGRQPAPRQQRREKADDGETEQVPDDEPSQAERRRAAGRVGPGRPSGYWERVRGVIYGSGR